MPFEEDFVSVHSAEKVEKCICLEPNRHHFEFNHISMRYHEQLVVIGFETDARIAAFNLDYL